MIEGTQPGVGQVGQPEATMALGPDGRPLTDAEAALQKEMSDPENVDRLVSDMIAIKLPNIWDNGDLLGFTQLAYQLSENLTPEQRKASSKKINSAVDERVRVVRAAEDAARYVRSKLTDKFGDYPDFDQELAALPENLQQQVLEHQKGIVEMVQRLRLG